MKKIADRISTTPIEARRKAEACEGAMWVSTSRYANNLLDACCAWTRQQGGTIHEFLPRLKWVYVGREGGTSLHYLQLDGVRIGWAAGRKSDLPPIAPDMLVGYLDQIPVDFHLS